MRPSQVVRLGPKAASKHVRPDDLEAMSTLKELGTLSSKPHRQFASHHRQPINTPGANSHQQLPDVPKKPQQPLLRLHQNVNKGDAGKILTRIESNVPVNAQKPQRKTKSSKYYLLSIERSIVVFKLRQHEILITINAFNSLGLGLELQVLNFPKHNFQKLKSLSFNVHLEMMFYDVIEVRYN